MSSKLDPELANKRIGDMSDAEIKAMAGQLGIPVRVGTWVDDEVEEDNKTEIDVAMEKMAGQLGIPVRYATWVDDEDDEDDDDDAGATEEELNQALVINLQGMDDAMRKGLFKPAELEPFTAERYRLIQALAKHTAPKA